MVDSLQVREISKESLGVYLPSDVMIGLPCEIYEVHSLSRPEGRRNRFGGPPLAGQCIQFMDPLLTLPLVFSESL